MLKSFLKQDSCAGLNQVVRYVGSLSHPSARGHLVVCDPLLTVPDMLSGVPGCSFEVTAESE